MGTDIDYRVIESARRGQYPIAQKKEIPAKYLLGNIDVQKESFSIRRSLKKKVMFTQGNLHAIDQKRGKQKFDIIFCRNVMIYFHKEFKEDLITHCVETIAAYKRPRWIEFLETLPKTATGKIQRFKLR